MPTFKSQPGENLAPEIKQGMEKAFNWLSDWIQKRANMKDSKGNFVISKGDLLQVQKEINDLRIYQGKNVLNLIKQDFVKGNLTGLKSNDFVAGSKLVNEISQVLGDYERTGGRVLGANEPAVIINPEEVKRQMASGTGISPQQMSFDALEYLSTMQRAAIVAIQNGSQDWQFTRTSPEKVLSSLRELRYNFGLDPTKVYTEADVAKLRAISDKNLSAFERQVNAGKSIPPYPKQAFPEALNNLSDKEITQLLNNVAMEQDLQTREGLGSEHATDSRLLADRSTRPSDTFKPRLSETGRTIDVSEHMGRRFGV